MDCRKMQLLISSYLDGELSKDGEAALAGHLEACDVCRQEMVVHERLAWALREIGREEMQAPPELCGLVMSRLRSGRKPFTARIPAAWRKALASAAAVLILAGSTAGVTAGLKMAGGGKAAGLETLAETVNTAGNGIIQSNRGPSGAESAAGPGGQPSAPGSGQEALGLAGGEAISGRAGLSEKEADNASTDNSGVNTSTGAKTALTAAEPLALLNSIKKITSTVLKVAVGDLTEARAKAVALAAGAGAATQVFPEQGGGKNIVVIRISADPDRAKVMIAELARLGTLTDRQDETRDIAALYNEALIRHIELQAGLDAAADPAVRQQLQFQAASYKRQLEAWEAESGKHIVVLWLEGRQ